ncbi:hypothetical protein Tco_0798461 [Tanacetum coccineum]
MIVVDEPLVFDEQLVQSMIAEELVLHMVVVVEEMCRIDEQLVKVVGDTVMDYIELSKGGRLLLCHIVHESSLCQ